MAIITFAQTKVTEKLIFDIDQIFNEFDTINLFLIQNISENLNFIMNVIKSS